VATDAKQKLNPSQLPLPTPGGQYSTTFKLLVVGDAPQPEREPEPEPEP
jgi:hypothetical protein